MAAGALLVVLRALKRSRLRLLGEELHGEAAAGNVCVLRHAASAQHVDGCGEVGERHGLALAAIHFTSHAVEHNTTRPDASAYSMRPFATHPSFLPHWV